MQHVRTKKEPIQPIPLFTETVELLMRVCWRIISKKRTPTIPYNFKFLLTHVCDDPQLIFLLIFFFWKKSENHHVRFNIDVKVQNDPERLFKRLNDVITSQPSWESILAPRILLGLWHPKFIEPAKRYLPFCQRSFIGFSIYVARKYFWNHCDAFSVWFAALASAEGQKYVFPCRSAFLLFRAEPLVV